jgi:hypothetical protein
MPESIKKPTAVVIVDGGVVTDIVVNEEFKGAIYLVDRDNYKVTDEYDQELLLSCYFIPTKDSELVETLHRVTVKEFMDGNY